jgi:citrate lyase beta subunit
MDLLARETRRDLAYGLFGKSAIHPCQVPVIESEYRVSARDVDSAERILDADAPAVFRLHGAMCERATHRTWAELTLARAQLYGVRGEAPRRRTSAARSVPVGNLRVPDVDAPATGYGP